MVQEAYVQRLSFILILVFALFVQGNAFAEPAPAVETTLYFGLGLADGGSVSEDDWDGFLRDVVTPRFPGGFSVVEAHGQWRDPDVAEAPIIREVTKILIIVHPKTPATEASIGELKSIYSELFHQKSVFHTESPTRIVE
ncbi:hypothetical protein Plav_2524 [Parvibaculum lavamentivorans DS-1]|uniref:Lipoprotein n=1 Tax=Parvibaculum lavamentivorans (strain DS-1 / DSM 13023 / NCIMB 13966) TaxID=402881 RepID=A7HW50_PARL1|nr:hypothetical protein Plav_2524 [Parvibaculum lavamentivorans DS-1]